MQVRDTCLALDNPDIHIVPFDFDNVGDLKAIKSVVSDVDKAIINHANIIYSSPNKSTFPQYHGELVPCKRYKLHLETQKMRSSLFMTSTGITENLYVTCSVSPSRNTR